MSFYAELLKKHGWTIDGLDVFIYEDKWVHHELDLIDFGGMINADSPKSNKPKKQASLLDDIGGLSDSSKNEECDFFN